MSDHVGMTNVCSFALVPYIFRHMSIVDELILKAIVHNVLRTVHLAHRVGMKKHNIMFRAYI